MRDERVAVRVRGQGVGVLRRKRKGDEDLEEWRSWGREREGDAWESRERRVASVSRKWRSWRRRRVFGGGGSLRITWLEFERWRR